MLGPRGGSNKKGEGWCADRGVRTGEDEEMDEEREDDLAVLGDLAQVVGRAVPLAKAPLHKLVDEQSCTHARTQWLESVSSAGDYGVQGTTEATRANRRKWRHSR